MKKSKFRYVFFLFIAISGTIAGLRVLRQSSLEEAPGVEKPDFHQTKAIFTTQLRNEEQFYFQEIKKQFGVDLSRIHSNCGHWHSEVPQVPKNEDPLHQLVYEVAKAYNFNADKLTIVLQKTNQGSPALSTEIGKLIIEMNIFPLLPDKVQRFIIAHEIQHILNNDFAEIRTLKNKAKSMTASQKKLFQDYARFREKRADISAALNGQYWAEGYLAFTHEGLKRCTKDEGITHPTYKERQQIAQSILDHAQGKQIF